MKEVLIPMIVSLIFAYFSEGRETGIINKGIPQKRILFTVCIIIYLSVYTGLRTWYNDTVTYIIMYEFRTPLLGEFFLNNNISFSQGIGFEFLNSVIKTIGFSTQDFIMLYGTLTMTLYITFIHKYAENFTLSIYLFFACGCFIFAQAAIKQSMAMAIGCWAFYYASERKWNKYIILIILSSLFHPYALIYLLIPFMTFKPWTPIAAVWVFGFLAVGISLPLMFSAILDITAMMGANYSPTEFSGEGVNIFRLLVCFAPTILSFIFRHRLYKNANRRDYLLMNLTMINGLIMFVGLFGTANYFARLANFFLPMQVLAIPWLVRRLSNDDRILVTLICVFGYFGYMTYENAIIRPFDNSFNQIPLTVYLEGLFR